MSEAPDTVGGRLGPPPGVTKLTIANVSATIGDEAFARTVAAVETQVRTDFEPAWGLGATLTPSRLDPAAGQVNLDGLSEAVIYVGDRIEDPNGGAAEVFGYHAANQGGRPYAFVYLDVCALRNEPWSCALSHEVLELLADPNTELTADGPAPPDAGFEGDAPYSLEVCDPTQRDRYPIDGVMVCNFVTRAYFGEGAVGEPTNFLELDLPPFGVRPGGYTQYDDGARMRRIDGGDVDAGVLEAQALMAEHRRNARREAALRPLQA